MGNKERTITYRSKDCGHVNLKKVAPLWYVCKDCGKVFNIPFSLQYDYQSAIEQLAKVALGIEKNRKLIKAGERKTREKEKREEAKAVKEFKEREKRKRKEKKKEMPN